MAKIVDPGPMMAVRSFVEAFNDDDVDRAEAACTEDTLIIDDFPPHEWTGNRAVARWYHDMARMAEEYSMSEPSVELEEPLHVIVSDRYAYVVVPIDVGWLQDGEPAARTGFMTVTVCEGAEGWRISACTWTWH